MDNLDIVYLNFPKDLLKSPMKEGLYRITAIKKHYFVVMLLDESYFMGDNYWILDYFMFNPLQKPVLKKLQTV